MDHCIGYFIRIFKYALFIGRFRRAVICRESLVAAREVLFIRKFRRAVICRESLVAAREVLCVFR